MANTRLSRLISRARIGALNLNDFAELVSLLPALDSATQKDVDRDISRFQTYYQTIFDKQFLVNSLTDSENVLAGIKDALTNKTISTLTNIGRLIEYGAKSGASNKDIARGLVRNLDVAAQNAETLANTGRLALTRASSLDKLINSGAKYFKYVGPEVGIRGFCAEHLNKIYTLDEIRAMNNGQGLPVEFYCGGYNCRHRWVAVSEAEYLAWRVTQK